MLNPPTRKSFVTKDVTFDENNFNYFLSIDPQGEHNSIKDNIPTTLPFPNLPKEIKEREVPQSQEDQAVIEQPNLQECPYVVTLPKYYVRRKNRGLESTLHNLDGIEKTTQGEISEDNASTEK